MSALEQLDVLEIYLDPQNPRHEPIDDNDKIIEHLCKNEKVKELAKDIAENGLNPLDLLGVVTDAEGYYIAVEGNRRLCALTLLNDPDLAPSGQSQYFKSLAKKSDLIPNEVECMLFESREEADIWIERRHEGGQGGIGIRQWTASQKTRHNTRRDKKDQNALAQAIIDFAVENEIISLEGNRNNILTTVSRYIGNPVFRRAIGIESGRSEKDVIISVEYDEFDAILRRFLADIMNEESDVSSRSKKADWEDYARQLISDGVAPTNRTPKKKLSDRKYGESGPESNENTDQDEGFPDDERSPNQGRERQTPNPNNRKYIVRHGFNPKIASGSILRRIFQEMREISIDEHTLAVSMVTRVFLECLYTNYFEKVKRSKAPEKTHTVLDKVIKEIETDTSLTGPEEKALKALRRVQCNKENALSPHTLGAHAHAAHYPDPRGLRIEWDNISAIIEYMLKKL